MAVYITDTETDRSTGRPLKHLDLWCAARTLDLTCSIQHKGRRPLPRWIRSDGVEIRLVENPDHGKDSFDTSEHFYERCATCFKPRMLRQQTPRGRVYVGQPPLPASLPPGWLTEGIAHATTAATEGGFVYEFTYEPLRVKHIGGARDSEWLRRRLLDHFKKTARGEGVWWWYDLIREKGPDVPLELEVHGPIAGRYQDYENRLREAVWLGGWQNGTLV